MLELAAAAILSIAVGAGWASVVRAVPYGDPARSAARRVEAGLTTRSRGRRFLRARFEPTTSTGLALTLAMLATVVVGVVFGVFVAMIRHQSGVVHVDVAVTRWAAERSTDTSREVFGLVTWAGSTIVVIVAALATTMYAARRWAIWRVALFFVLVIGGQALLANSVKLAVARVRPDAPPFHVVAGPSFPSGHAAAAAATWAAVALVLGRGSSVRGRSCLAGTAAAIAVVVACSRVFLGAHWTSDVVGGLLLGWTWFAVCAIAYGGHVLRLGEPIRAAQDQQRIDVQAPRGFRPDVVRRERARPG